MLRLPMSGGFAAILLVLVVGVLVPRALRTGERFAIRWAARRRAVAAVFGEVSDTHVDAVIAAFREELETTRRPVARIRLTPMEADELRVSKVGGMPYWPDDVEPPRRADGAPLVLLAQVNFAEVTRPLEGFPESGLLQIFVSADAMYGREVDAGDRGSYEGYRVVYWPTTDVPARSLPPPPSPLLPFDPRRPRRMDFALDTEVMGVEDHRFGEHTYHAKIALESYAQAQHVDALRLHMTVRRRLGSRGGHKLGGHADFVQGDPRRAGRFADLLLQLDSDEELKWGDGGVAGFFINGNALARADFRRVLYLWDGH